MTAAGQFPFPEAFSGLIIIISDATGFKDLSPESAEEHTVVWRLESEACVLPKLKPVLWLWVCDLFMLLCPHRQLQWFLTVLK